MSVREVVKLSRDLPNVSDILKDAMISQTYADVIFCCSGGQRFSAHRLVLSAASPYLQRVLSAHENAAGLYEPITVILPDVEGNDLAAVLGFVYTGCTAVSGERLEAFSSTAEALRIKIPPLPRPLTLSPPDIRFATGDPRECEDYYGDVGLNMTKRKLNQNEYLRGTSRLMSSSECVGQMCDNGECLNLEKKDFYGLREVRRPGFYVANRVSASPWCQVLRPHHLPRNRRALISKYNPTAGDGLIQTNVKSGESEIAPIRRLPTVKRALYPPGVDDQCLSADPVGSQTLPVTAAPEVYQKIVEGLREDASPVVHALPEPPSRARADPPAQLNHQQSQTPNAHQNNHHDNNNNSSVGSINGAGGGNQHSCKICDKSFGSRGSLKVHARLHSGEKPYRCKDCGKLFSQLRNYKYHRSIHEGTGEFSATCPECGKSFNDRGYLGSHMKIHMNRKEYSCTDCGKSFNQRVAYNMHVRIHSGIKPHQCQECGKAFSRKMLLKQHLRTHSGERPYKCHICHKAFADRSNMTLHTRLHSGLKPYQCEICAKSFTKKHHLKTHLNYHTGIKPYTCPNCSLAFSQSSNMRTHFKRCSINNKSVITHSDGKTNADNSIILAFTAALTPPYSDLEPSSKPTAENTTR